MAALFPDMPLPYVPPAPVAPSGNGVVVPAQLSALATEKAAGDIPGLTQSLIAFLQNYRPGEGLGTLTPSVGLTLPIPEWAWFGYTAAGTASYNAGATTSATFITVPTDERWWLDGFWVNRASGDNLFKIGEILQPPGYNDGDVPLRLFTLATNVDAMAWPIAVPSLVDWAIGPNPILLEPGAKITGEAAGVGSSASTFFLRAQVRRTKLIRAITP